MRPAPGSNRKRTRKMLRSMLWVSLVLACFTLASSMDDNCSACHSIADEIEIELFNEKPRSHKFEDEGEAIDYSEQKVVELLDGLCEKMQDFTLEKLETGEEIWVRVHDWNELPAGKDKQETLKYSRHISSFCARLLEETRDELTEFIKGSALKPGQIHKALCQNLSKHCDESDDDDDYDDYMDDEL